MLTVTSEKTSLRDLTISEIRRVAWQHINTFEFEEDFNDLNFLARVNYASRSIVADWVDWASILSIMNEAALEFVISSRKQAKPRSRFMLDANIFNNEKQFSLEFLTKNAKYLYLDLVYTQKCVTPEFLDNFGNQISYNRFFDHFLQHRDSDDLNEFLTYKDGLFRRHIMQSRAMRYMNREALEKINQPVPDYYDTVITEQRIMSGQPCDDGQRSFTIWLRKFRRVTGRPNDYPTWNEMLTLMKSHPRLNANGYVDWIMGRCLENTPEEVAQYPELLSFSPKRVDPNVYRHITGTDENQAQEDFNVEFADVIEPTVQDNADGNEESGGDSEILATVNRVVAEMADVLRITTPQMAQPMAAPIFVEEMPLFRAMYSNDGGDSTHEDDSESESEG